jgi:hypothetical protein
MVFGGGLKSGKSPIESMPGRKIASHGAIYAASVL